LTADSEPPSELPPNSPANEVGALACILVSEKPEVYLRQLKAGHFYENRHQNLFATLKGMEDGDTPINIVTVSNQIVQDGGWEKVGGRQYFNSIPNHTPSEHNFSNFLDALNDMTSRREAIRTAVKLKEMASDRTVDWKNISDWSQRILTEQQRNRKPIISTAIGEAQRPPNDDPTELLRRRFLCKHGGLLVPGPSGMGKSSWLIQSLAAWSNNLMAFGIEPTRPLRSLIVQAENDDGDLAEMRDGVATGLNFNQKQRQQFFNSVVYHTSTGITGLKFCHEVLQPLLDSAHEKPFDIVAIDPAFAFINGSVSDQELVTEFLRTGINPILHEYDCAAIIMHHTNKPMSGKEKPNWLNGELAYLGSGSIEWTNWARAVISFQATGEHGVYKLNASKRGGRLGWKDSQGNFVYSRQISWCRDGQTIYWQDDGEIECKPKATPEQSARGGRPSTVDEIAFSNLHAFTSKCNPLGETQGQITTRLETYLASINQDISPSTCTRIVKRIVETGKLAKGQDLLYRVGPNA